MLGFRFEEGEGVAMDKDQAASWFHKAAEQGHADAKAKLPSLPNGLVSTTGWPG